MNIRCDIVCIIYEKCFIDLFVSQKQPASTLSTKDGCIVLKYKTHVRFYNCLLGLSIQ